MAVSEKTEATSSPSMTPIEVMIRRWEAAQESYDANDGAHVHKPRNDEELSNNLTRERAMESAIREFNALEMAITYQRPENWRDVIILLSMVAAFTEGPNMEHPRFEAEAEAVNCAVEAVLTFVMDTAEVGELGYLITDTLKIIRMRTEARTATREAA